MMNTHVENQSLALTARWTASARAAESARADCLFKDPWASALAGAEGAAWLAQQGGSGNLMVIRTHYFDGFLQAAAHEQGIRQVVILAAGLDTRAYRLLWPAGTRLFELDQETVLQYKAQVLGAAGAEAACERIAIAVDLTRPWRDELVAGGFDPRQPTAWLLEGILFYLPNEAIAHLLKEVSDLAAPGSQLGCDVVNSLTLTSSFTKAWVEMQARAGAPWIGSLDDPEAALAEWGWQAAITQPGAPDAHFGRWTMPVIPVKMPNMPHQWYVTAKKTV